VPPLLFHRARLAAGVRALYQSMEFNLTPEDIAVDRRQRLVQQTGDGPADEVPGDGFLPRHDMVTLGSSRLPMMDVPSRSARSAARAFVPTR
jgi:hypothetical protein